MQQRAELQRRLIKLWSEKLGVPTVTAGDNFFALGGDSLLAADLLMDIYEEFGIEIDAAVLFLKPTIADLLDEVSTA
ncbi:phosphopantetheine-binding protein [Micromonospora sp. NBC_01638]|uniref:phosphopantetheine-binding protein n=1 Tax=Micromonospora sp. NBC_01638 TaxID=2975982 RepID=UPI00386B2000|nr:phosphopantetheine-binding protein [Micromonospora sp. NBC_01638]